MRTRIIAACTSLIALAALGEDAPSPEMEVPLTYQSVSKDKPFDPPVATEGFFLGFGQDIKVSDKLEGHFAWGGKDYPFRIENGDTEKPVVKIDGVPALPDDAYPSRKGGYFQAWFNLPGAEGTAQHLRLIAVFTKGRPPYAMVDAQGTWRGSVEVGDRKVALIVHDKNCDGDLSNDPVMLDADGDGLITPIERVKIGETVRVGSQALTILSVAPSGASAKVRVQDAGKGGRDLLAELAKAPVRGHPCPDFAFTDQHGTKVNLSDLKGKVVLLNFWDVG